MTEIIVGIDYETHLFGPQNLAPKPVCLTAFMDSTGCLDVETLDVDADEDLELATNADGDLAALAHDLFGVGTLGDPKVTGVNLAFDLAVMTKAHPELFPTVFDAISHGRISDCLVREKLLLLASTGDLNFIELPDGSKRKIDGRFFSLGEMTARYLNVAVEGKTKTNRAGEILEGADAWRLNYDALEDMPLAEWPEEAVEYAVWDAIYPCMIWRHQEIKREQLQSDLGVDPLATEAFRMLVNFCLYLMSCNGVHVDPVEHGKIKEELEEALTPEKLNLLVGEGILRPGSPPEPYANGVKLHVDGCRGKARKTCECPPKMTRGSKTSVSKKKFEEFALALKAVHGDAVNLRYTDKGNLQLDKEFLEDHYRLSPVLAQYRGRQTVQKLVTTDMPRMEWPKGSGKAAPILHACFDFLKETGRTSSYASKFYPSWNCQNPHPRVRACIVAPEGWVMYSVDYSGMELGTLAQKCFTLFGFSTLRDVINKGWDAHAYLGAHLAYYLDDDFNEACREECDGAPSGDQLYEAFTRCKKDDCEEVRKFHKHYRTFAKPTGLGYPGGLGPATFVEYAHATFKIECDEELATELREVWHKCFPEMKLYLNWINEACEDPFNPGKYAYSTPMGMYRAGASYCAAANGAGLQSPSAEGALLALCSVVEDTYTNVGSVLYADDNGPTHIPQLFIHDELIGLARLDRAHEVAFEVSRIMVESMSMLTPDVKPRADPVLMFRWNKGAEPRFDKADRLTAWTPGEE